MASREEIKRAMMDVPIEPSESQAQRIKRAMMEAEGIPVEPARRGEVPHIPEPNPAASEARRKLRKRVEVYWTPFLDGKEIKKDTYNVLTTYGISLLDDCTDSYSQMLKEVLDEDIPDMSKLIARWVATADLTEVEGGIVLPQQADLENEVLLNTQQEILVAMRAKLKQTGERERKAPIQKIVKYAEANLGKRPTVTTIEEREEEEVIDLGGPQKDIPSEAWINVARGLRVDSLRKVKIEVLETVPERDEKNMPKHDAEGELIFKKETVEIDAPVYKGLTLDTIERIVRDYLNKVTLSDGHIRTSSLEHGQSYGLIWAARSIALQIGTPEAIKRAEDLRLEYEVVRANLNWWFEAAKQPAKAGGGFSVNFNDGITVGGQLPGEYATWIKNSYRGRDFVRGFAAPREKLKASDFTNASELLGARYRSSIGFGSKDEVKDEIPGNTKPADEAGSYFMTDDGIRLKVICADGRVRERTKGGKGFMYETYKNFMLPYAYSYLETRYKYISLAFEATKNPVTGETVYICHISPDRFWGYDAFQHPKFMAKFWYGNIDYLADEFKYQLGWRSDLGDNPADNKRLNMALLGKGNDFLDNAKTTAQTRTELCRAMGVTWEEGWDRETKIDAMVELGMVRKFGQITWGVGDKNVNLILTENLINLDTERLGEEFWQNADWGLLPQGGEFLGDWCQQMLYLQAWRNNILKLLNGDKIDEAKQFMGSGDGWRHIPDVLSPVMEKERNWWFDIVSRMELFSFRRYREKGNRLNLAVEIRNRIPAGFLKGHFRRVWFAACGIRNMDWSDNIASIQLTDKVRQFLQGTNEVKVVEGGMLRQSGISYEDLAHFSGLKVKKYHHDMIHFLTDQEGRWDTWENIPILSTMKTFIDEYSRDFKENRRIIGDGGEQTKKKWIKAAREMEKFDLGKREELEKFKNLKANLGLYNDWDIRTTVDMIRKTLGIFEEWETEVDISAMSKFLESFLTPTFIGDGTRAAFEGLRESRGTWLEDWYRGNEKISRNIMQVWGEFEEMSTDEYRAWGTTHEEMYEKIIKIIMDWPKRGEWSWGNMERARPGLGAEELEMALWAAAEEYKGNFYERKEQPWRRFGAKFNLWEREKGIYRVVRRQKAAMDFRSTELKKMLKGEIEGRTIEIQAPEDVIVGRWHYNQMEWDGIAESGDLIIHDRPGDKYGGIDPMKSLLMGTGEFYAGDGREVSPLWIGHNMKRIIYRYLSRASVWYQTEHAKIAGEKYHMNWKEYWREYHLARRVMSPSKVATIIGILAATGTLDPNENVPYLRSLGATEKEVIQYWGERKAFRLPNDKDEVKGEVKAEIQGAFNTVIETFDKLTGGVLTGAFKRGRTGKEITTMFRNASLLGAAGSFTVSGVGFLLTGAAVPGLIVAAGGLAGVLVGSYGGLDGGDLVGGFRYFLGKRMGLLGDRINMRDPESLALGYVPLRIFGGRLPYGIEKIIAGIRPPATNDDVTSSRDTSQAVAESKEHLGGEGPKNT